MDPLFDILATLAFLCAALFVGVAATVLIAIVYPRIFLRLKGLEFVKKGNTAAALLLASIFVSAALLCSDTMMNIQQNLHLCAQIPMPERSSFVLQLSLYGSLQVLSSLALAFLVAFTAAKTFDALTKGVNELKEIGENNNLAAGIVLASIVIALTIIIKYPFSALVAFLAPMPKFALPL